MCHTNGFGLGYYIMPALVKDITHSPSAPLKSYPLIALICNNCGDTQFINLIILGFREDELEGMTLPEFPPDNPQQGGGT